MNNISVNKNSRCFDACHDIVNELKIKIKVFSCVPLIIGQALQVLIAKYSEMSNNDTNRVQLHFLTPGGI